MPHWELLAEENVSKSLSRRPTYPTSEDAYGEVITYDLTPPRWIVTFKGHGLTDVDLSPYRAAIVTRNSTLSITDAHGRPWVGRPVSLSVPALEGLKDDDTGDPYQDVTLQLEIT